MIKPILKVSVSESDSSSQESSENEDEMDVESIKADNDTESEDKNVLMTNESWADSVAKILSSNKPKNKKTLVLSRAKKHTSVVKVENEEKPTFEVVEDNELKDVKPQVKQESQITNSVEPTVKKKKIEKLSIRVKPNILDKDRERLLSKIATKGVVQLFNAVRNQQKTLEKEVNNSDLTEAKKEKILKKFDKRAFLDTLMGQTKSVNVDEETKSLKEEIKPEGEPLKWNALRDDFMMGAKMKDWDKESVDE